MILLSKLEFKGRLKRLLAHPQASDLEVDALYSRYLKGYDLEVIAVAYNLGFYAGKGAVGIGSCRSGSQARKSLSAHKTAGSNEKAI